MPREGFAPSFDPSLPIVQQRAAIEAAIAAHQVVVVCGQTGSGKTTQLPKFCLALGRGSRGAIAHTQPRRLAARAVAARISEELGEPLGGLVGVKVRFDDRTGPATRVKLMTDGMLLAELPGDPDLRAYDTVIIDEAHERSLNIDFLLGCLRGLLPRRPDLKVIVTSATIDPARFSGHFGGPSVAPVIEVPGRLFPIETRYRPVDTSEEDLERVEVEAVADAVEEVTGPRGVGGDVLVFLPGEREIRESAEAIRRRGVDADILPLISTMSAAEQDRIFHPGPRRRVVLSTNVAETSVTVPGIRAVVDTGLVRLSRYDPVRRVQTLPVEMVSLASANQRSGRCGRVGPGLCIRLFAQSQLEARPAFTDPEIRRTGLASVILRMKALGLGAIEDFPLLDRPDPQAIRDGHETLHMLGAVEHAGADAPLTSVGRRLAAFPVEPHVGRVLLAAHEEGSLREAIVLVAALSIQDPRERPMGRQEAADRAQNEFRDDRSDFMTMLRLWDAARHVQHQSGPAELRRWCRERFVSAARLREWNELVAQLTRQARDLGMEPGSDPAPEDRVHRALLTGLIANVACREAESSSMEYRGQRGNVVHLFPGSVLFRRAPRWIVAAEMVRTTRLYARTVARIDPAWIEELAPHVLSRQHSDAHLDAETGVPSVWERVAMNGVVIVPRRRVPLAPIDAGRARAIFVREALAAGSWTGGLAALEANRATLGIARSAENKLRRRGVALGQQLLAAWFDQRLPSGVVDPASLARALRDDPGLAARLTLTPADALSSEAASAVDPARFPDHLELGDGARASLEYALAPGKDSDGLTVTLQLEHLPRLSAERSAWLVPGMLPELLHWLLRSLPKAHRAQLEAAGPLQALADELAQVLDFAGGSLPDALSAAMIALRNTRVEPSAWPMRGRPDHLRLRVRVLDGAGEELAAGRDLDVLMQKLAPRLRKEQTARALQDFEREGLTTWDFAELSDTVDVQRGGVTSAMHPALVDRGESVALTLVETPEEAAVLSRRGVRRLLALACAQELASHLDATEGWSQACRRYESLGPASELLDDVVCVVVQRVFLDGQPPIRTREVFEARSAEQWGRLGAAARETADVVARILESRSRVAQRLSGGTPRLWAASIADLREQAAYLLPRGFVGLTGWPRLRDVSRFAAGMWERLAALREEGSGVETAGLATILPRWKLFTGWVAQAMADERAAGVATVARGVSKAAMHTPRRNAAVVDVDAGRWALEPGHLPSAIERARWLMEELRLTLLAPGLATRPPITAADVDRAWREATAASTAAGTKPKRRASR